MDAFGYKQYFATVTTPRSPEVLYRKRPWVPCWLWQWVAEQDISSQIKHAMQDANERHLRELSSNLTA